MTSLNEKAAGEDQAASSNDYTLKNTKSLNFPESHSHSNAHLEAKCVLQMNTDGFYNIPIPLDLSGRRIMFAGRDGDSRKTEWYIGSIKEDGTTVVTYNSHHDGLKREKNYVFSSKRSFPLDDKERQAMQERVANMQLKRSKEQESAEKKRKAQAEIDRERFNRASKRGDSAYLKRKRVRDHGIHFEEKNGETIVLVPMRDRDGAIQALQEIYPSKRLFPGHSKPRDKNFTNAVKGLFHIIGEPVNGQMIRMSEGYATSATIFDSTGSTVPHVVAFSAGAYSTVVPIFRELYPDSQIVICADNNIPDNPKDKNTGIEEAKKAAQKTASCSVIFPSFAEDKDRDKNGKRFSDFNDLMIVMGKEEIQRQMSESAPSSPNPVESFSLDPEENIQQTEFVIEPGKTHLVADRGTEILSDPECGVFQQQGRVVRIVKFQTGPKGKKENIIRPTGGITIETCDEIFLIETLNRRALWTKYDARSKENKLTDYPDKAAKMILSMKGKSLPFLKGFICSPTIREDGSLLEIPGYDEESGLFFNPCGTKFPKIPENPTQAQAKEALDRLRDLIKDFPFADDVSRSVALSELMTGVVRRTLDLAPFFANDASTRSSGKTLLAKLSSYISTGKEPTMIIPVPNEEEMGKRIGASFMAGDQILCIDNVDFVFESRDMCVIATSPTFNPRILGESKNPTIGTNCQVIFTGNNLVFKGDICTRNLKCRILPDCEHPEERKFDRNLEEYTPKHRGELVAAILTIIRAYIVAGFPGLEDLPPFRTYSNWTRYVRAPLIWLGEKDPYESAREIKEMDPENDDIRSLLVVWHEAMKNWPMDSITVNQLLKKLRDEQEREKNQSSKDLYDLLLSYAPDKRGGIDAKIFGNKIRQFKDRVIDGYRLSGSGKDSRTKATIWKVSKVD